MDPEGVLPNLDSPMLPCRASKAPDLDYGLFQGLEDLVRGPGAVVLGNPTGDVTIIEFFDYRCPYCRQMHPMLNRLLAEDHGVRFVAKEWPVFGGPSVTAAKIALAADWQGKYTAVHQALMEHEGTLDETKV